MAWSASMAFGEEGAIAGAEIGGVLGGPVGFAVGGLLGGAALGAYGYWFGSQLVTQGSPVSTVGATGFHPVTTTLLVR